MYLDISQVPDDEEILNGYLQASLGDTDQEALWPVDAFRILIPRDPNRAWRLICELIDRAPESLLPTIGVSQLEDFISRHGLQFIDVIEQEATKSHRFVEALANIWITRGVFPSDVEARLVRASREAIEVLDGEP